MFFFSKMKLSEQHIPVINVKLCVNLQLDFLLLLINLNKQMTTQILQFRFFCPGKRILMQNRLFSIFDHKMVIYVGKMVTCLGKMIFLIIIFFYHITSFSSK